MRDEMENLQSQLKVARNEINKLRQQVRSLQYVQRKDMEGVAQVLREFRCEGCLCRQAAEENTRNSNEHEQLQTSDAAAQPDCGVRFRAIGTIRTAFPEKRAVPRQSSVGGRIRSVVELHGDTFTNPEHALEGLAEYSHLWLIYHFHRNNAHPKAKVAPPRLGGERVGVFSTRSPHRPCPIGLSLVEIEKVEGATIAFFGTDMVDGTPVLDIKPYIPFYDAPLAVDSGRISAMGPVETVDFYNSRQEPDGEESDLEMLGASAVGAAGASGGANGGSSTASTVGGVGNLSNPALNLGNHISAPLPPPNAVKVPNWVVASHRLTVCFNERAENQLQELQVHRQSIIDVLEADPRSVYLRTKHGSQIFTFQLSEVYVTCKFDDRAETVTVLTVRRTENVQDESVSTES